VPYSGIHWHQQERPLDRREMSVGINISKVMMKVFDREVNFLNPRTDKAGLFQGNSDRDM
jgi:hypothetical protein